MAALPNVLLQSDADAQETQEWLDALAGVPPKAAARRKVRRVGKRNIAGYSRNTGRKERRRDHAPAAVSCDSNRNERGEKRCSSCSQHRSIRRAR